MRNRRTPLSRSFIKDSIEETITLIFEEKQTLSIIYADLDNFKPFNDTYGFAIGDKVLLFTCEFFKQ